MAAREILVTLRPKQWIKNGFLFAALLFSRRFLDPASIGLALLAFISFCLVTGAVYVLNDLVDIDEDRSHPTKCKRPLASGKLSKGRANLVLFFFMAAGLAFATMVNAVFVLALLSYVVLQLFYTFWLKNVVILDIFSIAAGFMIRVVAGGLAIRVEISAWLIVCTALLSLFLAMGKRRHELLTLDSDAVSHRPVLGEYSTALLDQMISVVTSSTLIAYCLYTISDATVAKFGTYNLVLTVPFVLYGIFRYLYLIHKKESGGSPEDLIISDLPLLVSVFLWMIAAAAVIYWR
jgi:4-hydroxybenzoate polyprenyltransferase